MKRLIVGAVLAIMLSTFGFSQEVPKWEVFGGYSYLRVNPGFGSDGVNTSGWEAAANYNFNSTWGLKADFSGHYCCDDNHMYNFMFGPQISHRTEKWTAFAHGLVGGSHAVGLGAEDTAVAFALGGGFDWNATDRLSIRVLQADYLGTHFLDEMQHNVRLSTGLVFRFGRK